MQHFHPGPLPPLRPKKRSGRKRRPTEAFWGKRVAVSLIRDLPVASPLPILVAAAIMIAFGLIAAYLPARRVMRVDPMVALRQA